MIASQPRLPDDGHLAVAGKSNDPMGVVTIPLANPLLRHGIAAADGSADATAAADSPGYVIQVGFVPNHASPHPRGRDIIQGSV